MAMAYEPLHHKYRPQRFADVVGQEAVTQTLTNAIRLNRIAPAYLFCGPRGTGKTSSARILAKSLNCQQGPTADPCGVCQSCREITLGTALDVIEIDAASNTGVDNIRELIERAQFAPVSSRYKVYVLDEVHMLSSAAFNALLKTLEEPPAQVIFVLATTDPQRVLPTVISRCQRFDYRRIPLRAMVEHLTDIAWKEGINITDEALEGVAQLSQGGLRDAESLLDQLSLLEGEISVESVWDLVGAVPERQLLSLIDAVQAQDPEQVLTQTRHLLDHGKEPLTLLQNLVSFYRDLLLTKTAPQRRDLVAVTQPTWEALQHRGESYDTSVILAAQHHLRQAEPQVRQTNQPRLWLEISLLDLLPVIQGQVASPHPVLSPHLPAPVASSPAPVTPRSTPAPAPAPQPRSQPPAPAPPRDQPRSAPQASPTAPPQSGSQRSASPEPTPVVSGQPPSLSRSWPQFLERVRSPVVRALMDMGQVIDESSTEVTLGFPNQGFAEKAKSKLSQIQPVINEMLGYPIKVHFGIKPSKPTPTAKPAPQPDRDPIPNQPDPPVNPRQDQAPLAHPQDPAPEPTQTGGMASSHTDRLPQTPLAQSVARDELEQASRRLAQFFNGVVVEEEEDLTAADQEGWTDPVGQTEAEPDDPPGVAEPVPAVEEEDELPF